MNLEGKSTKELFEWLLENFNYQDFIDYVDIGICEKVDTMALNNIISYGQKHEMKDTIEKYRDVAILHFGAKESYAYWWGKDEIDSRKKFIEYIIGKL
jgi:hypothetical protein